MISFPIATSNEPDDIQGEDVYEDFECKDIIAQHDSYLHTIGMQMYKIISYPV